jgi:hypothetical protein
MRGDRHGRRSRFRRSRLVPLAGAALLAGALGVPAPATAQPPTAETVAVTWHVTSHATAPPYYGTGAGTFVAGGPISDYGTASFAGFDVAIPSPIVAMYQGSFTLTGQAGTLTLRCHNTFTDSSDPAAVLGSGSCAITDGTGMYTGVSGQGKASSTSNFVIPVPIQVITISLNIVSHQ